MRASPTRRPLAAALAAAVATAFATPAAWCADPAALSGRVLDADGRTPRAGVTVSLVDARGGERARSYPTGSGGAFAIEAAAGRYDVVVETPAGAFVTAAPVDLAAGVNPPLALSLRPAALHAQQDAGFGSEKAGLEGWAKWTVVGVIAAAALFVILEAGEDEDEPSSPF
jgi:hypothetical protein